jgi:hypothetical protein
MVLTAHALLSPVAASTSTGTSTPSAGVSVATMTAASSAPAVAVSTAPPVPIVLKDVPNTAFWPGEKLKFVIKYEFIKAGEASMNVSAGAPYEGRPTLHIESKAESTGVVDKFFKVRDFNSTVLDRASLMSLSVHQNLHEGGYSVIRNTRFDYKRRKYTFERTRRGTKTVREGDINQPIMGALGAFFYARTVDLHPGDEISIEVFSDEERYPLSIKIASKPETITVPAGTFECLRIEPLTEGDAIFKASDGKMQIWLTNDQYRMPVLIRSKVFIGAFDAELESFERPPKPAFDTTETK